MSAPTDGVVVRSTARQSFIVGARVPTDTQPAGVAAAAAAAAVPFTAGQPGTTAGSGHVRLDIAHVRAQQGSQQLGQGPQQSSSQQSKQRHGGDSSRNQRRGSGAAEPSPARRKHSVTRKSPSDSFHGKYAVDVRGVTHSYDKKKDVLQKLDLQIEPGQIYGLLGPSGCGKTTLIKALLAQLDPKEGEIRVFGEKPGSANSEVPGHDVGYMPQEIALYDEFTIEQNLHFYGKVHNMPKKEFKKRSRYLCKLLDLKDPTGKNAGQLSGGQQRRASLACGLLHSPKLLILDEPTVGVDPTLRSKIWKYLGKISRDEGTTVLLTTHYIEEARRAHRVGLMRDGKMLRQGTPADIMKQTKCKTLEAAFLKICKKDEKEGEKEEKQHDEEEKRKKRGCWPSKRNHSSDESDSPSDDEPSEKDEDDLSGEEEGAGGGDAAKDADEAVAENEGAAAGGAGGDEVDDDGSGGGDSVREDEEADKARDARGSNGKEQARKSFSGLKNDDFHQPLLAGVSSPQGSSREPRRSPKQDKHLQSPEPNDFGAEEVRPGGKPTWSAQGGKSGSKGKTSSDSDGEGDGELTGWDKFSTALALPRWPQLWGLCWKNLMRLRKGIAAMIFQFILPSIQVILFCVAIGKDPQHIHLGIVNHDAVGGYFPPLPSAATGAIGGPTDWALTPPTQPVLPDWAAHIVRTGGNAGVLGSISAGADPDPKPVPADFLSRTFIEQLDSHFITHSYSSTDDAHRAVSTNAVWGYVLIPTNFTLNTLERIAAATVSPLAPIANDTLANSTLRYTLDMSNEQMTIFLVKSISESYRALIDTYAPGLEKQAPLQMDDPVYGDAKANFSDFVAPGIIITIAFSSSIGLTAITFVLDKKTGNLDRTWASGVRASEIMLAQVLTQLIIFVVQIGLLLVFGLLAFKLPSEGSVPLLFLICILLGVTGMMFGLVIASKVTEERDAMQCALGSFFPALLLSGVMWPVESIPTPLYQIALGLPTTWAAEAGRSIMSRGWGIEHRQVWLGLVVPFAWSFVFFLWAAKSLRAKK